jgi:hypothetical protein
MGGPDGIPRAMLDEFAGAVQCARSGQAAIKVLEAPGLGAEAALVGGLQAAAELLASTQTSQVARAALKVSRGSSRNWAKQSCVIASKPSKTPKGAVICLLCPVQQPGWFVGLHARRLWSWA